MNSMLNISSNNNNCNVHLKHTFQTSTIPIYIEQQAAVDEVSVHFSLSSTGCPKSTFDPWGLRLLNFNLKVYSFQTDSVVSSPILQLDKFTELGIQVDRSSQFKG